MCNSAELTSSSRMSGIHNCSNVYMYINMRKLIWYLNIFESIYTFIYICICIYIYVYIYTYIYIYIYVHT
jgi:hypothetical protein